MLARGQTALILMLTGLAPAMMAADKVPRTDHYGDPLPSGAIARLGTLRMRHQGGVASMDFSPDGKVLASAGEEGILIRLWDTRTGKERRRICGPVEERLDVLKYSPTGRILAGGGFRGLGPDGFLLVWDAATGKLLHRLERQEAYIRDITFADEKTLISVDSVGKVDWWDIATGKKVRAWEAMEVVEKPNILGPWQFAGIRFAKLARDGRTLAAIVAWEDKGNKEAFRKFQNRLTVWNLDHRRQCWYLAEQREQVFTSFDLSADGKILTLADRADVSIRDSATGRELRRLTRPEPREGAWESIALSRDGKRLATLSSWTAGIYVWDVASGKVLRQLRHNIVHGSGTGIPQPMIFSSDGKTLAFSWENTLALWDTDSPRERPPWEGHRESVEFLCFAPDGQALFSGGEGGYARSSPYARIAATWDTAIWRQTGRSERSAYSWFSKTLLFVSRDHRLGVARSEKGDFFIAERTSGKLVRPLPIHSEGVPYEPEGFFSPSGKTIVYSIPKPEVNPQKVDLALLDVATGKRRGNLPEEARQIFLAFAPEDRIVAWIDEHAVIHVATVEGGKELRRLGVAREYWDHRSTAVTLTLSPDGRHLAFWERHANEVVIWDLRTGKRYRRLSDRGTDLAMQVCLTFSPDSRCLAIGGMADKHDVELWEVASGQLRRRIPGHLGPVRSLAFSPDGRLLASGSDDTTILIWDPYGLASPDKPMHQPTPERLQALWTGLAHADAQRAADALTALVQTPQQTASLLSRNLQSIPTVTPEKVVRTIADLDSNDFAVREKAERELEQLTELAEPALRQALTDKPSLEARRRIEALLDKLDHPPAEQLRRLRAVEVLELLGTPEARKLLQRLAEGAPAARLTQEAKASLERLARRPSVP